MQLSCHDSLMYTLTALTLVLGTYRTLAGLISLAACSVVTMDIESTSAQSTRSVVRHSTIMQTLKPISKWALRFSVLAI